MVDGTDTLTARRGRPVDSSEARRRAGVKRRVLIVDDDALILEVLRAILDLEEFDVLTAPDGETGLQLVHDGAPDVVVCDVMMPGMDGYAVCRAIKGDPRTASIPVILLTARDLEDDVVRGKEAGCDSYLTKPFSPLALIEELGSLVVKN